MPRPILGVCLVICALIAGCGGGSGGGSTAKSERPTAEAKEGGFQGTGYSAEIPAGWRDRTKASEDTPFRLDALLAAPAAGGFATNINVIHERPGAGVTLDAIAEQFHQQVSTQAAKGTLDRSVPYDLAGVPARTHAYLRAPDGGAKVRQRQVFTVKDGAVYTITFSARAERFAEEEPVFEGFLESWRWED